MSDPVTQSPGAPVVVLSNLTRSFTQGGVTMDVLRGVDMEIMPGEIVALRRGEIVGVMSKVPALCLKKNAWKKKSANAPHSIHKFVSSCFYHAMNSFLQHPEYLCTPASPQRSMPKVPCFF